VERQTPLFTLNFNETERTAIISQKRSLEIVGRCFCYSNTANASTIKIKGSLFLWAREREETLFVCPLSTGTGGRSSTLGCFEKQWIKTKVYEFLYPRPIAKHSL